MNNIYYDNKLYRTICSKLVTLSTLRIHPVCHWTVACRFSATDGSSPSALSNYKYVNRLNKYVEFVRVYITQ